jgi:hypothetical protein
MNSGNLNIRTLPSTRLGGEYDTVTQQARSEASWHTSNPRAVQGYPGRSGGIREAKRNQNLASPVTRTTPGVRQRPWDYCRIIQAKRMALGTIIRRLRSSKSAAAGRAKKNAPPTLWSRTGTTPTRLC